MKFHFKSKFECSVNIFYSIYRILSFILTTFDHLLKMDVTCIKVYQILRLLLNEDLKDLAIYLDL